MCEMIFCLSPTSAFIDGCYPSQFFFFSTAVSRCPAILGELLPSKGYYYWETVVSGCPSYRLGITYSSTPSDSLVGENSTSWCMHCVPTSNRYEVVYSTCPLAPNDQCL